MLPHDRGIHEGNLAHARARELLRRRRRPLSSREPELPRIVQSVNDGPKLTP